MADWDYPALGFDPLPGDPMVILALRDDTRAFGTRLTDEAARLARLARPGVWEGAAAEAYAAGLDELPRDLQRCGDAFVELARALENYHDRFVDARREAQELERRAAEARTALDAAAGDIAVTEALGAVLHEAADLAEKFDESVDDIATAIRRLAGSAPDAPFFARIRHWAASVLGLSLTHHRGEAADALRFFSIAAYPSGAERARAVQVWAAGMTDAQWEALITVSPELVASTAGVPYARRYQANRVLIERSLAETRTALAEARSRNDNDAVTRLERRERTLRRFLEPRNGQPRQFLFFDNTGDGRVGEVFGDLAAADNVAVMVPGMANTLDNFENLSRNSERLQTASALLARRQDGGNAVATVAWLGYDTPGFSGVLSDAEAKVGATELREFDDGLLLRDGATTTVVAHSYGSLVTGTALRQGLHVDNVAVVGSPGIGVDNVEDLHLPPGTDFWAGRAPLDPVALSEWHGADPTDPRFGGRRFETGQAGDAHFPAGHSSYFEADSDSLKNLARIVTDEDGRVEEVKPSFLDRASRDVDHWQETHRAPAVVDDVVDSSQELVDKVADVTDDVGEAAEREIRKAGKWLSDRWPG